VCVCEHGNQSSGFIKSVNVLTNCMEVKLSLCLIKHHAMKMYRGVDYNSTHS
jgi:hypothetical protein